MLGSPSAQQLAKVMGRSMQRSQDDTQDRNGQAGTSRPGTVGTSTLGRMSSVASREGSIRVFRNGSTAMSGLSSPEGSTFRANTTAGDDKFLVQTPTGKDGGGLEAKVTRLEWIMSDIQMQLRGITRGQQTNLEAFLKGNAGGDAEIVETPVQEIYDEIQELPVDEQFKHLQKMRADTQVYFPVATEIWANNWNDYELEDSFEYTHSRYSPVVTTDCREFAFDGYTFRVTEMGRKIRLLVCITLYNEGQETVDRSLLGVCENLEYFIGKSKDFKHKILDWSEICVCLVQDGIEKASPSVLAASTVHGYYSPELLQKSVNGEPVNVHMFEYTSRYEKFAGRDQYPPLQIIFLVKQHNKGKLDSHSWYFDAVAHTLEPDYCVLIDAGTYPRPSALPELFMHFERDPGCGAATGELTVERPFRNFLTTVQFCEWKTAHLLNKPIESLCGYLTVLPGAFSAFRWKAVEGDPLRAYFLGLYAQADLNAFESNMFLAEDRILCLEIVAKENCAYKLQYVKDSVAEADPQTTLVDLIKQRRRWLNGTFFALVYSLIKWGRIWKYSKHTFLRKVAFTLEGIYLFFLMVTGSWLGLGLYYTALDQVVKASFASNSFMAEVGRIIVLVYLFLILVQVIVNLHNKPEAVDKIHLGCALYFTLFMMLFTGLTLRLFIVDNELVDLTTKIGAVISMGGGLAVAIFHGSFMSIAMSGLQYWLAQPIYMNILQIHAFCNTHDISWGTKNLDKNGAGHGEDYKHTFRKGYLTSGQQKKESKAFWDARLQEAERKMNPQAVAEFNKKKEQKFKAFATYLLIAWLTTNVVLARVIESLAGMSWTVCNRSDRDKYIEQVKRTLATSDDHYLRVARIVEASEELLESGEEYYPFGGIPDWPPEDQDFLMTAEAQSPARKYDTITVAVDTFEATKEISRLLPPWDEWVGYLSSRNSTEVLEDIENLALPSSINATNITEIECKVYEGRTVYLRYLFVALACLTVIQTGTSLLYIFEYRIWKLWWAIKDHRERRRRKRLGLDDDGYSQSGGNGGNHAVEVGLLDGHGLKIKVNAEEEQRKGSEIEGTIPSRTVTPRSEMKSVLDTYETEVGFMLSPPQVPKGHFSLPEITPHPTRSSQYHEPESPFTPANLSPATSTHVAIDPSQSTVSTPKPPSGSKSVPSKPPTLSEKTPVPSKPPTPSEKTVGNRPPTPPKPDGKDLKTESSNSRATTPFLSPKSEEAGARSHSLEVSPSKGASGSQSPAIGPPRPPGPPSFPSK